VPGTPYLYYGEEIGMLGVKPDVHLREPFIWGEQTYADTNWLKPEHSIAPAVVSLEVQRQDPGSLYNHYKKWIDFRRRHEVLSTGHFDFIESGNRSVLAYSLSGELESLIVIHNLSSEEQHIVLAPKWVSLDPLFKELPSETLPINGHQSLLFKIVGE
jgi:glycosidase